MQKDFCVVQYLPAFAEFPCALFY